MSDIYEFLDKSLYRLGGAKVEEAPTTSQTSSVTPAPSTVVDPANIDSGVQTAFVEVQSGGLKQGKTKFDNTETGFILGIDNSDSLAKFYIGNTTNYLNWTGTQLVISGSITATTGAIGGWTINATSITDTSGATGMSSAVTGGDDIRFWAGDSTPGSAEFRVYESGALVASSATITGAITATSGSIGSFTIGTYLYTGTKTAFNDANAGVHIGSDGIGIGNNVFTVDGSTGALVATSATITGAITATSGAIGGFNIGADYIRDAADTFGLASTVTGGNDVRFWSGDTFANRATAELRIYEDGSIVGTNATFTGALFATSGWIGAATALVYESQGINTGTTGWIRGGQTSYNTGTGYFLGYDTGAYKLSIGVSTGDSLTWDGSKLTVAGTFSIGGTTMTVDTIAEAYTALTTISAAGGGTLYLDAGTYTLTANLDIPAGVTLQGVSRDGVIIDCDGTYAVRIIGTNIYSTGTISISDTDTTVVGSGTTFTSGMVGRYIYLHDAWYEITVFTDTTHITISPAYSGNDLSSYATAIADVNFNPSIKSLTITGATGSGMVVSHSMEPNLINLYIYGNGTGLDLDYVIFPKMDTLTVDENGVNLDMNFVEGPYVDYSEFSYSTTGAGIVAVSTNNGTIFNFSANGNTGDGINATNCDKLAYISFDISNNGGQGIEFVSGCDDNQIDDGQCSGNTSDNIKFTATSDRNIISAITIKNAGGYGVNIAASTCDDNTISSNAFSNNTSGSIQDLGVGTSID